MKKFILDGKKMTSISDAHKHIKNQLNFPLYYGENLDALWDILSTIGEPTSIFLMNCDSLKENLSLYAQTLLDVIYDAACENENIIFSVDNQSDDSI